MAKIAFIGLGVMGFPMAGHLSRAGHQVTIYNRNVDKGKKWLEVYTGIQAFTPKAAAKDQDIVFACVGNDEDLRAVTLGAEGAFAGMGQGSIFVDHTTASASVARELFAHARELGFDFIDAPVSGGQAGAENGKLSVMCGGDASAFDRVVEIINVYGLSVRYLGASGSGQLCKMVNQICIAGLVQALSEGLNFGIKAGLDMKTVLEVVAKGAAGSWQMENRGASMVEGRFDFGFAVDWMRKDLKICLDEASRNGASLPVTALVDQFYGDVQRLGGQRFDTSSLILRLEQFPKSVQRFSDKNCGENKQ